MKCHGICANICCPRNSVGPGGKASDVVHRKLSNECSSPRAVGLCGSNGSRLTRFVVCSQNFAFQSEPFSSHLSQVLQASTTHLVTKQEPMTLWLEFKGIFDCTANNRKFAVGVGWCASNQTEPSETDCKFPLQTVEAHF